MTGIIDPALFGMPNATNTGVPAGTTLTAYTGPMTITTPGTVIDGMIINGTLTITAANVTIKNCVVQNYGFWGIDASAAAAIGNVTVQNCTLTASSSMDTDSAIVGSGTFIGNNISNGENGFRLLDGASVVRDNYIHDLNDNFGDPHYDGIALQGGQNHVLIEHNTVSGRDTSDIFIKNDFGPINDITVTNNLLIGDPKHGDPASDVYVYGPNTTNVTVANNYMEKSLWEYVAVLNANPTISGNIQWNNNTDPTPYPSSLPSSPSPTPPSGSGTVPSSPSPTPPSGSGTGTSGTGTSGTGTSGTGTSGTGTSGTGTGGGQNLVTNGSFETGDYTGWTRGGNYGPSVYGDQTFIVTGAESGKFAAGLGPVGSDGTLSQDVHTTAGQQYAVSFWLANQGAGPNDFTVTWNGQTELALANKSAQGYTQYSFTATGTAGTSHLEFDARQDPAYWSLDNVSVVAVGSAPTTGGGAPPTTPTSTPTKPLALTDLQDNHQIATIKGTADANSQIKLYDGTSLLGSVKAGADGSWSFTTSQLSNTVHTFKAQELDSSGQVTATSGKAILGSSGTNTLTSSSGNDIFDGNGHPDTFVFAANFGHDVIEDFHSGWRGHDTIQFSKSEFASLASVLSHASQVGQDVVIATGNDSLTLKNTKLSSLDSHDFHFA